MAKAKTTYIHFMHENINRKSLSKTFNYSLQQENESFLHLYKLLNHTLFLN